MCCPKRLAHLLACLLLRLFCFQVIANVTHRLREDPKHQGGQSTSAFLLLLGSIQVLPKSALEELSTTSSHCCRALLNHFQLIHCHSLLCAPGTPLFRVLNSGMQSNKLRWRRSGVLPHCSYFTPGTSTEV